MRPSQVFMKQLLLAAYKQLIAYLFVEAAHQFNKSRRAQAAPMVKELLDVDQILHPALLGQHLRQAAPEAPARRLHLVKPLLGLPRLETRELDVGRSDG